MRWEAHEEVQKCTLLSAFFAKRPGKSLFSVSSSSFSCAISSQASELHQNRRRTQICTDFEVKCRKSVSINHRNGSFMVGENRSSSGILKLSIVSEIPFRGPDIFTPIRTNLRIAEAKKRSICDDITKKKISIPEGGVA